MHEPLFATKDHCKIFMGIGQLEQNYHNWKSQPKLTGKGLYNYNFQRELSGTREPIGFIFTKENCENQVNKSIHFTDRATLGTTAVVTSSISCHW